MVTNNKVLTVSYGTFSCTLEGFEDSFDTMKAIAEYFRDLASDDRYFGAEPPTPDAEMLTRIAEREIERRVSARMDQGAIVLSAKPPASEPDPEDEAASAEAEPETAAEAQPAEDVAAPPAEDIAEETVEADVAVADEPATQFEEAVEPEADIEEVAETAAPSFEEEFEPVAEESIETVAEEELAEEAQDTVETLAASDVLILKNIEDAAAKEDAFELDAEDEDEVVVAESAVDMEILAPEETIGADTFFDEDVAEDDWAEDEDAAPGADYEQDSIAAKLERIRAVVARSSTDADSPAEQNGFVEDQHAIELPVSGEAISDTFDADLNAEDSAEDTVEAVAAALAEADLETDLIEEATTEDDVEPEPAATEAPPLRARVVRMKKADFEQAVASGLLEADAEDTEAADASAALADEDDVFEPDLEDAAEDIFAEDQVESPSSLTPEDEADLMAELAEVEAEIKRGPIDAPIEPAIAEELTADLDNEDDYVEASEEDAEDDVSAIAEEDTDDEATAARSAPEQAPEPDLSRLMAKADSEMEEPEGSRRRRAIAHLRAAVAATKAEKAATGDTAKADSTVAYRDDLASVVRAVPGGKSGAATKLRGSAAPLKLVAEQRVDEAAKDDVAEADETQTQRRVPVRPRRVSADRTDREEIARSAAPVGANADDDRAFAEYAASVGVRSLSDALEAAAAYVTFVKEQPRFSRPMLMRMTRELDEANFSREEGLRTFGQLLRDKKIRKLAGGRFTAEESIGFQPADRAAG